ncbi:kinase RLK-Pelle-CrRLK1L-1 family protein [Tanacetum coccineum]
MIRRRTRADVVQPPDWSIRVTKEVTADQSEADTSAHVSLYHLISITTMSFPTSHEAGSSLELLQPCRQFTFSEIQLATENFDESLVIGRGGFGKVYKGTIIHGAGGLTVAIKRLESTSNQGAVEFRAEVEMLTKLRHCHLVSLIGYCKDGQEMILVYEYMPRGTLEDHLHKRLNYLPWVIRLKICIGAARGLEYLHTGTGIEHGVIHRDVKSSNILLHKSWAAKISDFGLSKIGPTNQPSTYVNTLVKGTFGYLDPNYFNTGRLTRKSDVYAFGVVLFEVLCRKRAVDSTLDEEQWGLASWAQDSIKEGRLKEIIDTSIKGEISSKCLKEFAQLAGRCLHSHPKKRPTMAEVVVGLDSILALQEKANKTSKPAGGMTIFGRKIHLGNASLIEDGRGEVEEKATSIFPSTGENSGGHLKSLELFFDTLGNENKVLYKFDSETISIATNNFSDRNIILDHLIDISTYKGRLPNGQVIAIVRPNNDNSMNSQFMNEASILVQLEHENLVNLLGYCIEGTQVLLVYEYAANESLSNLLYGMYPVLDWNKRFKIILGVARVLVYLHKHAPLEIIHCNVQPGNILLDTSLNPKLWDFRWARTINDTNYIESDHSCETYCTCDRTRVIMAPEYSKGNICSNKVDVFSFGILVLETISGRNLDRKLNYQVWRNWLKGTPSNIIDPRINVNSSSMTRFIEIGLLCIQEDAAYRPTMEQVVDMLVDKSSVALLIRKVPAWVTTRVFRNTMQPRYTHVSRSTLKRDAMKLWVAAKQATIDGFANLNNKVNLTSYIGSLLIICPFHTRMLPHNGLNLVLANDEAVISIESLSSAPRVQT